jgi:hypothetical protein
MQVLSISMLAVQRPETFGGVYWSLMLVTVPVVLPCTLLGVYIYRLLSDVNFRRVAYMLLGTSGVGLLAKAAGALSTLGVIAAAAAAVR